MSRQTWIPWCVVLGVACLVGLGLYLARGEQEFNWFGVIVMLVLIGGFGVLGYFLVVASDSATGKFGGIGNAIGIAMVAIAAVVMCITFMPPEIGLAISTKVYPYVRKPPTPPVKPHLKNVTEPQNKELSWVMVELPQGVTIPAGERSVFVQIALTLEEAQAFPVSKSVTDKAGNVIGWYVQNKVDSKTDDL